MKLTFTLLLCLLGFVGFAQDNLAQTSIQAVITRNEEQIIGLAEAFSEDQYDWSPGEGVRSVGEALMHVAQANYFFLTKLGFDPPEGLDMMNLGSVTGKDNILEEVKNSFAYAKELIPQVESDQLSETVEFPFGEFSKMSTLLILMEHSGEHKGQLIAYARSNGIVPPWSEQ